MEWLKKRNLKQSFMAITCLFLCVGILLAIGSVLICVQIRSSYLETPKYEIVLDEMGELSSFTEQQEKSVHAGADTTLSILQMALPVFWVVLSLILADITFYNVKLKQPISVLQAGAERIQRQDLDFEIVSKSSDELGKLCASFEIMRRELKQNNQELWRQAEERKRLNAAFSHDLRNPITVLKGSAKMLKKETDNFRSERIGSSVSLILQYTERIEKYVEMMNRTQKLEEIECCPLDLERNNLQEEFDEEIELLATSSEKKILASTSGTIPQVRIDKEFFFRIAENLIGNALRYAENAVTVHIDYCTDYLVLTVEDDGMGFPTALLEKGPAPFQREDVSGNEHFGIGLYICKLLCEKHKGSLRLENTQTGAKAIATLKYWKP